MNISSGHATAEGARSRNWFYSCFCSVLLPCGDYIHDVVRSDGKMI